MEPTARTHTLARVGVKHGSAERGRFHRTLEAELYIQKAVARIGHLHVGRMVQHRCSVRIDLHSYRFGIGHWIAICHPNVFLGLTTSIHRNVGRSIQSEMVDDLGKPSLGRSCSYFVDG